MRKLEGLSNEELVAIYQDKSIPAYERDLAINQLIVQNEGYIHKLANEKKAKSTIALSDDELCQAGRMGIFEAAKRYTPDMNTLFITYANYQIKCQMGNYIKFEIGKTDRPYYTGLVGNVKKAIEFYKEIEPNSKPTDNDIAEYINRHSHSKKAVSAITVRNARVAMQCSEPLEYDPKLTDSNLSQNLIQDTEEEAIISCLHDDIELAFKNLTLEERLIVVLKTGYPDRKPASNNSIKNQMESLEQFKNNKYSAFSINRIFERAIMKLRKDPALVQYDDSGDEIQKLIDTEPINLVPFDEFDDDSIMNILDEDFPDFPIINENLG